MLNRRLRSFGSDVAAFLHSAAQVPVRARGRLIVAIDATASREPTWAEARRHHAALFDGAAGLQVQLVWFRGRRDFAATPWMDEAAALGAALDDVDCRPGFTQIARVLAHAVDLAACRPLHAVAFVGDAVEEEPDHLYARAHRLAAHGVPLFLLQEGRDAEAARVFRRLAEITDGAWWPFGAEAGHRLPPLLAGVAAYAAGQHTSLLPSVGRRR